MILVSPVGSKDWDDSYFSASPDDEYRLVKFTLPFIIKFFSHQVEIIYFTLILKW